MKIWQFLPALLAEIPDLEAIKLHEIEVPPPAQRRAADDPEVKKLIDRALEIRMQTRIPFWEMVLLLSEDASRETRALLLDSARTHQPKQDAAVTEEVARDLISERYFQERISSTAPERILVLSSLIRITSGEERHLRMLDFRTKVSIAGESVVTEIVQRLGASGAIFNSGNSYHYYGRPPLLDSDSMRRFLGMAILFSPFVDARWIGHQLVEGACALRISRGVGLLEAPSLVLEV